MNFHNTYIRYFDGDPDVDRTEPFEDLLSAIKAAADSVRDRSATHALIYQGEQKLYTMYPLHAKNVRELGPEILLQEIKEGSLLIRNRPTV